VLRAQMAAVPAEPGDLVLSTEIPLSVVTLAAPWRTLSVGTREFRCYGAGRAMSPPVLRNVDARTRAEAR